MRTISTLLLLVATFSQTIMAQTLVSDSISMGAGYANAVFYSFEDGEVANTAYNTWDIAFTVQDFVTTVRYNGGFDAEVYEVAGGTAAYASIVDTNDVNAATQVYDSDETWFFGAFEMTATGHPNYGWGDYNSNSHNVIGSKTFIIKTVGGNFKKLVIDSMVMDDTWYIHFADLDGSNEITKSFNKSDYTDNQFVYLSLDNDQLLDIEPDVATWDIVFTKFVTEDYNGYPYQAVTGVLTNEGVQVAEVNDVPAEEADITNYTLTENISGIGWNWKDLNYTTFQWELADSMSYFVKANNDSLYQIWFTGFGGSSNGNTNFSFQKVVIEENTTGINDLSTEQMNIYPNPATDKLTIAGTSINNIQVLDLSGRSVYTQNVSGTDRTQIDLAAAGIVKGIYLIQVTDMDGTFATRKLIVQ